MFTVIDAYKRDVDRTLLRENLKLTPQQRFDKFHEVMRGLMALRQAGMDARARRLVERQTETTQPTDEAKVN